MVEVLGYDLETLFENTKLNGTCTYKGEHYAVYEVNDDDYYVMCDMTEERFKEYCPDGWWRSSDGSILGIPDKEFTINGKTIFAWDGIDRENFDEDCRHCGDFQKKYCSGSYDEWESCYRSRIYPTITKYILEEHSVSTEKNVCALLTDLARYNGLKMSELLRKYEG